MKLVVEFEKKFNFGIGLLEIIAYSISFLIISFSIIRSAIIYTTEMNLDYTKAFNDSRLDLHESIALALSFILGIEILKLYSINTYKQLIIVLSLVGIKLLINYLLLDDINKTLTLAKN